MISDLAVGEAAVVMCVGGGASSRLNTLAVFGMAPGVEVTVLQQRPACVIQVGETELAVDPEIANDILVVRAGTEMPTETLRRLASDAALAVKGKASPPGKP